MMCAHAALSSMQGDERLFACSAGHAFLCEAMSREDDVALPHILNKLLDMQLLVVSVKSEKDGGGDADD